MNTTTATAIQSWEDTYRDAPQTAPVWDPKPRTWSAPLVANFTDTPEDGARDFDADYRDEIRAEATASWVTSGGNPDDASTYASGVLAGRY